MDPNINFTRPTYHATKSVMKKSDTQSKKIEEASTTVSTAATSVVDRSELDKKEWSKKGVSIAPITVLQPGTVEFEKMLWSKFNKERASVNVDLNSR